MATEVGRRPDPVQVLVLAADFHRVRRHCARLAERGFEVHFVEVHSELFDRALDQRFGVVVLFLPMPRPILDELLARTRADAGRLQRAGLVLLADRSQLGRTPSLLARGVTRVLAETAPPEALADVVVDLLRRAPRAEAEVPSSHPACGVRPASATLPACRPADQGPSR